MKIKSLENYTKAMKAIVDFKEENKNIFDEFDSLRVKAEDAEKTLKEDVKDNHKTNIANEFIRVTYSPAFSKGYNVETILNEVTPSQKRKLTESGAIVIKESIDKKKLVEAVEQGVVPVELRQKAYEEKELSPRVMIKEVKHEQEENN